MCSSGIVAVARTKRDEEATGARRMTLLVVRRHFSFRFGECDEQSDKSKKGRKMKNAAQRCAMHSPSHSLSLSNMNRSHTAYTFAHGHDAPSGIFQSVDGILEPGFGEAISVSCHCFKEDGGLGGLLHYLHRKLTEALGRQLATGKTVAARREKWRRER
jgi:hypothetical protein